MTTSTREKIINLAQDAIATRGYSAFSFRELAADLGIKSASIHYHFPTKTHLGLEVARTYRARLAQALENIAVLHPKPHDAIERLIAIYRHEVNASQRMTVCTMLAAEIRNLPVEIQEEMHSFYELNVSWLDQRFKQIGYPDNESYEKACQVLALLQGALMGAKAQVNPEYFDVVARAATIIIGE